MLHRATVYILLPVLLLLTVSSRAQVPLSVFASLQTRKPGQGTVQIKQSPDITNMINLHLSLMQSQKGVRGYRVCIYYNSGQEANKGADQERAKFISRYEDVKSYKVLESPFFKVYVGDFRTKSEALKFLERIRYDYPNAFIRDNVTVAFPY